MTVRSKVTGFPTAYDGCAVFAVKLRSLSEQEATDALDGAVDRGALDARCVEEEAPAPRDPLGVVVGGAVEACTLTEPDSGSGVCRPASGGAAEADDVGEAAGPGE